MKSTGIVRRIDELGRVVLPIELRKTLGIEVKDPLEVYVDGNSVILRKHETSCCFCGKTRKLSTYKDKHICAVCLKEIKDIN